MPWGIRSTVQSVCFEKQRALTINALWFCHSGEWLPPVTRPGPLREVLAVIQAGLSGSVGGHVFSFAALGCLVFRCYRPHRVGRLFCLTRCALPRRRHLAAPSLTPFTRFGDWRRFPAPRAVDHCARLLLCSMREGDVKGGPVLISGLRRGTYSALGRFIGSRI